MLILPVLDLMNGVVVRGIAGRRQDYRPIVTPLSPTPEPVAIAEAFRTRFGLNDIYIADVDAIAGQPPAIEVYRYLRARGFSLWVDAGLRTADDAAPLLAAGVDRIIAGLETIIGPEELTRLSNVCSPDRIVFSLDLRAGEPMGWSKETTGIVGQVAACGIQSVIVLDVARVGLNQGPGTEELCRRLLREFPRLSFYAGGGVRGREDLERLRHIGVAGALVASALHDGRLSTADLTQMN